MRSTSRYDYSEDFGHRVTDGPHEFYLHFGLASYALPLPDMSDEIGWHCYHVWFERDAIGFVVRDMGETLLHVNIRPEWVERSCR